MFQYVCYIQLFPWPKVQRNTYLIGCVLLRFLRSNARLQLKSNANKQDLFFPHGIDFDVEPFLTPSLNRLKFPIAGLKSLQTSRASASLNFTSQSSATMLKLRSPTFFSIWNRRNLDRAKLALQKKLLLMS